MRKIRISNLMLLMLSLVFAFASCGDDDENEQVPENVTVHEYVDLGLPSGLKWATCNVGALSPEDYGDYFAWGETQPKSSYDISNSKTYRKDTGDISGISKYDVARSNWGGTWRMPTRKEIDELTANCKWEWTSCNGIKGMLVTGPNGNTIFLPAAGLCDGASHDYVEECGYYWSSSPYGGFSRNDSDCIYFNVNGNDGNDWYGRFYGFTVRPVSD